MRHGLLGNSFGRLGRVDSTYENKWRIEMFKRIVCLMIATLSLYSAPLVCFAQESVESSKASVAVQKWEYKAILCQRSGFGGVVWQVTDASNGKSLGKLKDLDIAELLNKLGEEGWDLVSVAPRSSHSHDAAGVTSDEFWIFKRAK